MSAAALLPRHHDEFRSKEYWDTFFQQRTDAFEWYGEYQDLRKLVCRTLRRTDRILVIGCGNSNFSAELYDDGFEEVENVDFSQPVVAEMCRAHAKARPRMTWRVMDVTDMTGYEDGSFDAVVDKGTLDALMSEDTADVRESGQAMLREVARVLKPGGRYMCVTLWQDFIGSTFLSSLSSGPPKTANTNTGSGGGGGGGGGWTLDLHSVAASSKPSPYLPMCVIATKPSGGVELEVIGQAQTGGDVGGGTEEGARVAAWCDRTGRPLAPGTEPSMLRGEQEVLTHVREAQRMHRRRYDLREIRPGRFEQEDLWGDADVGRDSPRFTLLILDVEEQGGDGGAQPEAVTVPCAVVIIPRGRDRDFTFKGREGLEQVARSASARRLIAVRLNRGHTFADGVEGVKTEISPVISEFAPDASAADTGGPGIPIMAVSDELGVEGKVVAEGRLECSGDFVVEEDEEEDDDEEGRPAGVYRRLVFLANEGVVQTEVRMLGEDEDDGTKKPASKRGAGGGGGGGGGKKGKGKGKGNKGKKSSAASSAAAIQGAQEGTAGAEGGDGAGGARVDFSHLCFEYHRCMIAGAALADLRPVSTQKGGGGGGGGGGGRAPTALVIGLGGGALPMALRRMYPGVKVVAVELDPEIAGVAKQYFGLRESDGLKVVVEDGLAFVKAAASAAATTTENTVVSKETTSATPAPQSAPPLSPTATAAAGGDGNASAVPPRPPEVSHAAETGWGGAYGPPYSAIFMDVDSKDTSVGMSCPPAAFLEPAFLASLKTLLHGGGGGGGGGKDAATGGRGGGGGGAGGAGVLAINVAARSETMFRGALDAIRGTFVGGEVHKLRAGEDDVNSVLLAMPRPRGRARSGPLVTVAEHALASATVSRKAVASIIEVCEGAEVIDVAQPGKASAGGQAKQGLKSGKRRTG